MKKYTVFIGLFWAAVMAFFLWTVFSRTDVKDAPDWHKTHYQYASAEDAAENLGEDLLVHRMVLTGLGEPYIEYVLETEEGGSLADRTTWSNLHAKISYGTGRFDTTENSVYLIVYFDSGDRNVAGDAYTFGVDDHFKNGYESITIGGITVEYIDNFTGTPGDDFSAESKYSVMARFSYNGYVYFLSCNTNSGPGLAWDTLTQMLVFS